MFFARGGHGLETRGAAPSAADDWAGGGSLDDR